MPEDANPEEVIREVFRMRPWALSRTAVANRVRLRKIRRYEEAKARAERERPDSYRPPTKIWEYMGAVLAVLIILPIVAASLIEVLTRFTGIDLEELPSFFGLVVDVGYHVFVIFILLSLLLGVLELIAWLVAVLTLHEAAMIDWQDERVKELARMLRKRFSNSSIRDALDALERGLARRSQFGEGIQAVGAVAAGAFALVEVLTDRGEAWVAVLAAIVALVFLVLAERSRTKKRRLVSSRDLLAIAVAQADDTKPVPSDTVR